jgi:hypothetical protein
MLSTNIVPPEQDGNLPKRPTAQPFQCKREKSTAILLAIIIAFLACHMIRFIIQIYEVASSPLHGGQQLFQVIIFRHRS